MSVKVRTLGQPEETAVLLALLSAVSDVVSDSGFRAPRRIADGRLYRHLTLDPDPAQTADGLVGTAAVLRAVLAERARQVAEQEVRHRVDGTDELFAADAAKVAEARWEWHESDSPADWTTVLLQQVYQALAQDDPDALRAGLVQVATVAAAWIEDIDSREEGP